jgi:hypothetical protein
VELTHRSKTIKTNKNSGVEECFYVDCVGILSRDVPLQFFLEKVVAIFKLINIFILFTKQKTKFT